MNKKVSRPVVGLKELREHTSRYISRINKGESFIVLRRSKPVFKISPPEADGEIWETVVDFTKIDKDGVPAGDILKALKSLHGEK